MKIYNEIIKKRTNNIFFDKLRSPAIEMGLDENYKTKQDTFVYTKKIHEI